jgi:hypothetical protein
MHPTTAYKVLTAAQMHTLEHVGSFAGAPVDLADGYVHMSPRRSTGISPGRTICGSPRSTSTRWARQ